ncbi:MAG TPA: LuxR C-terminal-related transcriptional regulator [Acidimicrobiales bacterium]|jgi:DNA-binding NarL/FixJ family response regulator
MTAPLQVIAVSFTPDADFEGRILDEVDRLQGRGILRVLDLLFVAKGDDGTLERISIGEDEDFGSLLGGVVPSEPGDLTEPSAGNGSSGFDPGDAWALAESLPPGGALAFLLVEHHWAAPLFDAIAETGAALLGGGFLSADAGRLVGAEVAAMEEAAQVVAEAQAYEGRALLRAIAAGAEAEEAVAASEAIQAAAAADAVEALIAAGLIEEAAAHEAVSALAAAGLVVAGADEATEEAIAEDAATITAADEVAAEATEEADARIRAASITVAEAQVLRYLPKPLPFSLIADKLGISRSAAKDRAERLYRKLGVHSRDEAVSRARELGLSLG